MSCRYSSHLLVQEDNEQVQKLNGSFRDGEKVSAADGVSLRGHAGADKSLKPKVSSALRVRVGAWEKRWGQHQAMPSAQRNSIDAGVQPRAIEEAAKQAVMARVGPRSLQTASQASSVSIGPALPLLV